VKEPKYKRAVLIVIAICSLVVIAFCVSYIINYYQQLNIVKTDVDNMSSMNVQISTEQETTNAPLTEVDVTIEEVEPEKIPVVIPVDFQALQTQNPDIYAWINVPGTIIDYPILQSESDNEYYLNHTVDGVQGFPGSIYTENYNTKSFTDRNTVIYGHKLKNGTMFSQLHKYRDSAFFEENPYIYIYTLDHIYTYKVFAAYITDDKHILLSYDFSNPAVYKRYIDEIFLKKSMNMNMNKSLDIGQESKIITLSTCTVDSKQRMLVQAVLIKEE
jgi:sortase B